MSIIVPSRHSYLLHNGISGPIPTAPYAHKLN